MKQLLLVLAILREEEFRHVWVGSIEACLNLIDSSIEIGIGQNSGELKTTLDPFSFLCTHSFITMIMSFMEISCINVEQISADEKVEVRTLTDVLAIYKRNGHTVLEIQHSGSAIFTFETY